jgi:transcriptional repressor NrdR
MVCIYCGGGLAVANSRTQRARNQTWRRRKCEVCQALFTSIEYIELSGALSVEDADNNLQAFSRNKLFASIYESCRHRPNAADDAGDLADTIIAQLVKKPSGGILAVKDIYAAAIGVLERFDKAAAVQYGAFHSKN